MSRSAVVPITEAVDEEPEDDVDVNEAPDELEEGEDDGVAPEGAGEVAETIALDPHLVIRANAVGVTPEELQEWGDKADKFVAKLEARNTPRQQEQAAAEDEDDGLGEEFDERIVKNIRGTKAQLKELQQQNAMFHEHAVLTEMRGEVEVMMEDSTALPAELRTAKNKNAIVKAMVELYSKPGGEQLGVAEMYKKAEAQACGEQIKAKAQKVVKPTVTRKPNAVPPPAQGKTAALLAKMRAEGK